MFPCSSFSLGTLLSTLAYFVYQASAPSTDISWGWDAPIPVVGFDYGVPAIANEDVDVDVCQATPDAINGLLEPTVFVTNSPDSSTRLLQVDDLAIAINDAAPQGIIWQLLEPAIVETVSAVVVVLAPAATRSIDDAPTSVPVPQDPSIKVVHARWTLRTFKSQALSAFVVVAVISLVRVLNQASRSFYFLFSHSIPILASHPWCSSFLRSNAEVPLFTTIIMVLISFVMGFLARSVFSENVSAMLERFWPVITDLYSYFGAMAPCVIQSTVANIVNGRLGSGMRQDEVVMENIPVLEEAEHLRASANTASLASGSVCDDVTEPSSTPVAIQGMPEVSEIKDGSIGADPVSRTSIRVQSESLTMESKDISVPAESQDSLNAMVEPDNIPSQTMTAPEVFSFPAVTSIYNLYTMAPTISFPSVDDDPNPTEFELMRKDILVLRTDRMDSPSLSMTALGPCRYPSTSTSTSTSAPRVQRRSGFEYFDPDFGADARHLWAREFWFLFLRKRKLIRTVYEAILPVKWPKDATIEEKARMAEGVELVLTYARRLSEHAVNPILRLPGNVLPEEEEEEEEEEGEESVLTEEQQPTIETSVPLPASVDNRPPSPFVRPSNPQSRYLDSSTEGSVAAPATPSPSRRRPALARMTNRPSPSPSRTPIKIGRIQGAERGVLTPPPSLRPKLVKRTGRFPVVAPAKRQVDESGSSTRPARVAPSSSKLPRWRG